MHRIVFIRYYSKWVVGLLHVFQKALFVRKAVIYEGLESNFNFVKLTSICE